MNDANKDKYSFVVAFLAAILALAAFKDDFVAIPVSLGFETASLFAIASIFVVLVGLSTYFVALHYAFDFLRDSKVVWLSKTTIFIGRVLLPIANFFYFLGMIYPVLIGCLWLGTYLQPWLGVIDPRTIKTTSIVVSVVISTASVAIGVLYTWTKYRQQYDEALSQIQDNSIIGLESAKKMQSDKSYALSVIELSKVLEGALRGALLKQKGYLPERAGLGRLVQLSSQLGIISDKSVATLHKVADIRNRAVHTSTEISEKDARFVTDAVTLLYADLNMPRKGKKKK